MARPSGTATGGCRPTASKSNLFEPHLTYHRADANGELVINRSLDVRALTMMHDFAMTANHVIFMDLPTVFDPAISASGKRDMPYRWDDDYAARYSVSVGRNGWIRHDLTTGSAVTHDLGDGGPGEAVFVPAAGAPDETNDYYLGYVYDPTRPGHPGRLRLRGPPVATIKLATRVPHGFHGSWIAS